MGKFTMLTVFVNDLLKLAKEEIFLIDNYIDDTVFTLFF